VVHAYHRPNVASLVQPVFTPRTHLVTDSADRAGRCIYRGSALEPMSWYPPAPGSRSWWCSSTYTGPARSNAFVCWPFCRR